MNVDDVEVWVAESSPVFIPGDLAEGTIPASWLSGASGAAALNGSFADWRGRDVDIAGTWNDNYASQAEQWSLRPGFLLGHWSGNVDDAVGGIFKDRGETWAAAAAGDYDERWSRTLRNVAQAWGNRPGTVYLRFAHEFNGDWFPWSVTASETDDFKAAWRRFRALQLRLAPRAKLVFCPNADTNQATGGLDWRAAFPGSDQVDVVSVDYYNQWPFARTVQKFATSILAYDRWGAPHGLERFRQFAQRVGRPFAISVWSSNADMGDSPAFVTGLHQWLGQHGGTGPGQVLYEVLFNVEGIGTRNFEMAPDTRQPRAAARYQHLW